MVVYGVCWQAIVVKLPEPSLKAYRRSWRRGNLNMIELD